MQLKFSSLKRRIVYDRKLLLLSVECILYDWSAEYAFLSISKQKAYSAKCSYYICFISVSFFLDDLCSSLKVNGIYSFFYLPYMDLPYFFLFYGTTAFSSIFIYCFYRQYDSGRSSLRRNFSDLKLHIPTASPGCFVCCIAR